MATLHFSHMSLPDDWGWRNIQWRGVPIPLDSLGEFALTLPRDERKLLRDFYLGWVGTDWPCSTREEN